MHPATRPSSPNCTWLIDDDLLVLVNAWWEPLDFVLPDCRPQAGWQIGIDSYDLTWRLGLREKRPPALPPVSAGSRATPTARP
jgi:hypothetical protein